MPPPNPSVLLNVPSLAVFFIFGSWIPLFLPLFWAFLNPLFHLDFWYLFSTFPPLFWNFYFLFFSFSSLSYFWELGFLFFSLVFISTTLFLSILYPVFYILSGIIFWQHFSSLPMVGFFSLYSYIEHCFLV